MNRSAKLAVGGGDVRQAYLASLLRADGHDVHVFAMERHPVEGCETISDLRRGLSGADAVILPVPLQHGDEQLNAPLSNIPYPLGDVLDAIPAGALAMAGAIPFWAHARAVQNELRLLDYLSREDLAILNAVPTCEGAIQLAMEQTAFTIQGAKCLVIGCGRIGMLLAQKLCALNAEVTVSARSARDFARLAANGLPYLDTRRLAGHISGFDILFNTVPAPVLGAVELSALRSPCLILDLASLPGGIAADAPVPSDCKIIHALSLPGSVAPLSAARSIHNTVVTILTEEGIL